MSENKAVVTLESLVGKHFLSGVDFGSIPPPDQWSDTANTMTFVLDGIAYQVSEDPSDGYRSSMRDIEIVENNVVNVFEPIEVVGSMRPNDQWEVNDVLELCDSLTGKIVLEAGTRNTNDYYPCYVANFTPENMCCNAV